VKIAVVRGGPGGLYFALLAKKRWPSHEVVLFERNRADDTFGFGVVFSDETLGIFSEQDRESYEQIRRNFAYWGDVAIHYQGHVLRCGGNGFCGCSRHQLLALLQARCHALGVQLQFQHELAGIHELAGYDLVVAADGINSGQHDLAPGPRRPSGPGAAPPHRSLLHTAGGRRGGLPWPDVAKALLPSATPGSGCAPQATRCRRRSSRLLSCHSPSCWM